MPTTTIGRPSTGAVSPGEVAALEHEVLDDPVEDAALISLSLGLVGELDKVFHSLGNSLAEQTNLNLAHVLPTNGDVEPNLVGHLWPLLCLECRDTQHCNCKYLQRERRVGV